MADAATEAADLLLAARRDPGKKLTDLPVGLKPADRAAAYAIQRRIAATFRAIGGWKVSPFIDGGPPLCGALPASGIVASPAKLSAKTHALRGIEAEIAVRIGRDLPPRATPYRRDDIITAIAAMHPAIEVLESRFIEPNGLDVPSALADTQAHGGFVYGAPVAAWQGIDLARESVEQFFDGAVAASRTGHPAGDLVAQLVWLANEGSTWAGGLKAGQFVTCGSWTGAQRVGPAASVRVKFSTVGEVLLSFTA